MAATRLAQTVVLTVSDLLKGPALTERTTNQASAPAVPKMELGHRAEPPNYRDSRTLSPIVAGRLSVVKWMRKSLDVASR